MSRRLALFLMALSFVLLIAIAYAFSFPLRPLFTRLVVTPLIEAFLVLRWYVHRLSQVILWGAFVLAGAAIVLLVLVHRYLPERKKKQRYILIRSEGSELWRLTTAISHAHHRPFARRRVAGELVSLCVRLIAQHERLSLKEARERFESFQWCNDDEIREFFNFRRQYYGVGQGRVFEAKLRNLVSFLERYHQGA